MPKRIDNPDHGTAPRYNRLGCRCPVCVAGNTQRCKDYRDRVGYKLPNPRQKQLRLYGVTVDEYELMLIAQDCECAICGRRASEVGSFQWLDVDHCHETNTVRGLLCRSCNTALGLLQHDAQRIHRTLEYLS